MHDRAAFKSAFARSEMRMTKSVTYCLSRDERTQRAIRLLVARETVLESEASQAPRHVLPLVDVRAELLDVEGEVPVYHVLAHVEPLLVVRSHSCVAIRLNVERVHLMPRTYHVFKCISLFEFQVFQLNEVFEHALAALVLSHELDQLVHDTLEVLVCLISELAIPVEVHEVLHSLSLRVACLTDEREEQ